LLPYPKSIAELPDAWVEECGVEAEHCESDLLEKMQAEGPIEL